MPALRDTLREGYPALGELNAALPTLRTFAREAIPGVRSSVPALDAAIPWFTQARGLVQQSELKGLAADLRHAVPSLVKLNTRLVPFLQQLRALSSCTNHVLVPFIGVGHPEHRGRQLGPLRARADQPQLRGPGGREPELRRQHAGVPHPGREPVQPAAGQDRAGARRSTRTRRRRTGPDVPCETQDPPNLNAPGGDATALRRRAVKLAIKKHWIDFLAIAGPGDPGRRGIAVYLLSQQDFRFPLVEAKPKQIRAPARERAGRAAGAGPDGARGGRRGRAHRGREARRGRRGRHARDQARVQQPDPPGRDARCCGRRRRSRTCSWRWTRATASRCRTAARSPSANTLPDIDPDEIYSALDADTRPYLKLLVAGAGKGLKDRGDDLREVFRRLEPIHRDLARVTRATAVRRTELKRADPRLRPPDDRARQAPAGPAPARDRVALGVRHARPAGHGDLRRRWRGCPAR